MQIMEFSLSSETNFINIVVFPLLGVLFGHIIAEIASWGRLKGLSYNSNHVQNMFHSLWNILVKTTCSILLVHFLVINNPDTSFIPILEPPSFWKLHLQLWRNNNIFATAYIRSLAKDKWEPYYEIEEEEFDGFGMLVFFGRLVGTCIGIRIGSTLRSATMNLTGDIASCRKVTKIQQKLFSEDFAINDHCTTTNGENSTEETKIMKSNANNAIDKTNKSKTRATRLMHYLNNLSWLIVLLSWSSFLGLSYYDQVHLPTKYEFSIWNDDDTANVQNAIPCDMKSIGRATHTDDILIQKGDSIDRAEIIVEHHGVALIPNMLSKKTASELRSYIKRVNSEKKEQKTEFWVYPPERRHNARLGVNDDPIVARAMAEIGRHEEFRPLLDRILGPNASIVELCAITSLPGAPDQNFHADISEMGSPLANPQKILPMLTLFTQLQDTPEAIGPTQFCSHSHSCNYMEDGTQWAGTMANHCTQTGSITGVCQQGSGFLFNPQLAHRGLSNEAYNGWYDPDRVMLLMSFAASRVGSNDDRILPLDSTYAIRWDMLGHTIDDAATAEEKPWSVWRAVQFWPFRRSYFRHLLGGRLVRPWTFWDHLSFVLANEDLLQGALQNMTTGELERDDFQRYIGLLKSVALAMTVISILSSLGRIISITRRIVWQSFIKPQNVCITISQPSFPPSAFESWFITCPFLCKPLIATLNTKTVFHKPDPKLTKKEQERIQMECDHLLQISKKADVTIICDDDNDETSNSFEKEVKKSSEDILNIHNQDIHCGEDVIFGVWSYVLLIFFLGALELMFRLGKTAE